MQSRNVTFFNTVEIFVVVNSNFGLNLAWRILQKKSIFQKYKLDNKKIYKESFRVARRGDAGVKLDFLGIWFLYLPEKNIFK